MLLILDAEQSLLLCLSRSRFPMDFLARVLHENDDSTKSAVQIQYTLKGIKLYGRCDNIPVQVYYCPVI